MPSRIGVLVLLGWLGLGGEATVRGDDPPVAPGPFLPAEVVAAPELLVPPEAARRCEACDPYDFRDEWRPATDRKKGAWHKPLCSVCYADHNTLGCTSWRAEMVFMFGSCRAFYGEPCQRRPEALPRTYPRNYYNYHYPVYYFYTGTEGCCP